MKKNFSLLKGVLSLIVATALLCFSSCHKEKIINELTSQKTTSSTQKKAGNNPNESASAICLFPVELVQIVVGQQSLNYCIGSRGICHVYQYIYGGGAPCPYYRLTELPDNCKPCNDPWAYKNIFVDPIISYIKYFPNSSANLAFVPTKVTSNIAVLQFYAAINGTLDSQTLTLPGSFSLPKEISQNLGLIGNTIPAGTYPVVFDAKSKTFNAIVKVQ